MARRRKISRYRVVINNSAKADKRPGLYERHFRKFAFGVICIWILTRVFDFSLMPPSYQGLFITRPYYGLHSWDNAHMAWAARSHAKYGLGYTRGYSTPAVGDPPSAHPQRYVSHPSKGVWAGKIISRSCQYANQQLLTEHALNLLIQKALLMFTGVS